MKRTPRLTFTCDCGREHVFLHAGALLEIAQANLQEVEAETPTVAPKLKIKLPKSIKRKTKIGEYPCNKCGRILTAAKGLATHLRYCQGNVAKGD